MSSGGNTGRGDPAATGFSRVTSWMNAVGTLWIFALMVLVNADIIGRDFFDAPVRGTTEMTAISIVGIVFLQLAHTLWAGRLTRSDALLGFLDRRKPRLSAGLRAAYNLTGAGLMAVIFTASLPYFQRALDIGEYIGAVGDFTAPTWPVRLIILIGSAATCIQFALLAWREVRTMIGQAT